MLRGRYRLDRMLGRGGTSTVYLATDTATGQLVALKQISLADFPLAEAQAMARQLEREAEMLQRLSHPSLVKVLEYFQQGELHYLVLEYVEGCDLEHHLQTRLSSIGTEEILGWIDQVCDVLEYLHGQPKPVLFRDMKPSNLMLDRSGRVRLIDFGIARFGMPGSKTTALLRGFGTPGFSPIEQYVGGTDERSDIYALGATLYALVCHRPPPDAAELAAGIKRLPAPRALQPHLGEGLERVILKMLEMRKEDRYQTVAEARAALRQGSEPAPPSAPPFCPYRDMSWLPSALGLPSGPCATHEPFTIVYQGPDPNTRQMVLDGVRRHGRVATALWREDWPGVVPGHWVVVVAH